MAVSIKDIARLTRVSHSTVSRALSRPELVNAATVTRIVEVARELGYRPNSIGRSLVTRRTRTVGVVVTTVADPFVAEVIAGIEDVAHEHGYAVYLANSNANAEREISVVRSFQERCVDGVVVMASRVGALYGPLLNELNVPIVLIDNQYPGEFAHSISIDDYQGALTAVRHLLELGHRRIAYIGDQYGLQSDTDRRRGYEDALRSTGVEPASGLVVFGDGKLEGGRAAMQALLALRELPTAVFCYNDMTAAGALRALHSRGVDVPSRMSVAGFDDLPISSYLEPPLTTVQQPRTEMGRAAARMVLELISGGTVQSNALVEGELMVRESTAPPRS